MEQRLKNLESVMAVQTTSYDVKRMNKYIKMFVNDIPDTKIYKNHGNLYVTRGEADLYPCVVAHTDTVHDIHKEFTVQTHKDIMYAINQDIERAGIGGDDKVGVFVALEILRTTPVCKVAFFRDEEVGCVGSKLADMKFFDDVTLVMQCDRRGYDDFVNSIFYVDLFDNSFSQAVAPLLKKYGKVETDGGMTDVWQLAENGLGVACANMSCGYYDPHSDNEYIKISEVFLTLELVKDIVDELGHKKWSITPEERNSYSNYGYGSYYGNYGGTSNSHSRHSHRSSYRRYGSEARSKKLEDWYDGYVEPAPSDKGDDTDNWKDEYGVDAKCLQCESETEVCYDDTVQMYWCYHCDDYLRDEMVEFNHNKEDIDDAGEWSEEFLNQVDGNKVHKDDGCPF